MRLMRYLKMAFVIFGLLYYCTTTYAQAPNYTGTWILNLQKSQLESKPGGLTGSVFVIAQNGDKFVLTRYHIIGDKKKRIKFKMTADGKTRRIKVLFRGKLEKTENGLKATLWRKSFSNVVVYRFGENENEFIADEVFEGRPQNHHNIWVFDRKILK